MHHLRAAGVSLIVDARGAKVPSILHWGADVGELDSSALESLSGALLAAVPPSSIDEPPRLSLVPTLFDGWSGRPGLEVHRVAGLADAGASETPAPFAPSVSRPLALRLVATDYSAASAAADAADAATSTGAPTPLSSQTLVFTLADAAADVTVTVTLELTPEGVLRLRHRVRNDASSPLAVDSVAAALPLADRARELLDFTGLWTHERTPQRHTLGQGIWSREHRHGRPGHDDAFLFAAGTPGFTFRTGEVWATHLAWSGDKALWAERSPLGASVSGSGELLAPGEITLADGEHYESPWTIAVYSAAGLDGVSARLHPWIRSWSSIRRPRPVVLNTWEAVYFDHDLPTLLTLVDQAARVGVERFVLDDGWFEGRTDDRRALGDWFVDAARWPDGLSPLVDAVRAQGMDFGLWVEPEMVNPDSTVAREHPDWILGRPDAPTWRFQRVLDLSNPEAFAYILGRLDALLGEYDIAFLKWDHNRDLLGGSAHRQTAAFYRLLDAVRAAHPHVEIESCASGGARIDLGVLERVERVWTSDTNDPLERQAIQRYTSLVIPPEYLGGHLGAAQSHTTWRTSDLEFRLVTALFGSAGIEWNLNEASPAELDTIAAWIDTYKRHRGLLHTGTIVRSDASDPALHAHGVVSRDQTSALFAHVSLAAPRTAVPAPLRLPGLEPDRLYRVRPLTLGAAPRAIQDAPPAWIAAGEVVLSGRILAEIGLAVPLLAPEQAQLFTADAL
nr:alpha-galactosidase [Leifsonia sp. ALI-44-B]